MKARILLSERFMGMTADSEGIAESIQRLCDCRHNKLWKVWIGFISRLAYTPLARILTQPLPMAVLVVEEKDGIYVMRAMESELFAS